MQMEAFRKVQGITYVSTMCTGNLRSATACIYTWKKTGDKKILENGLRYFKVILWFVIGAAAEIFQSDFVVCNRCSGRSIVGAFDRRKGGAGGSRLIGWDSFTDEKRIHKLD